MSLNWWCSHFRTVVVSSRPNTRVWRCWAAYRARTTTKLNRRSSEWAVIKKAYAKCGSARRPASTMPHRPGRRRLGQTRPDLLPGRPPCPRPRRCRPDAGRLHWHCCYEARLRQQQVRTCPSTRIRGTGHASLHTSCRTIFRTLWLVEALDSHTHTRAQVVLPSTRVSDVLPARYPRSHKGKQEAGLGSRRATRASRPARQGPARPQTAKDRTDSDQSADQWINAGNCYPGCLPAQDCNFTIKHKCRLFSVRPFVSSFIVLVYNYAKI